MSRYAQDLLIWVGILSTAFVIATVVFYGIWKVAFARLIVKSPPRGIHVACGACLAIIAIFANVLTQVFGMWNSTLLWAYVISPALCTLPVMASYFGMTLACRHT
jgi:hypothetical protein